MHNLQAGGSIHAGGDIIVGDNNKNQTRFLVDCSNEELREVRQHRQKVLSNERWRIFKHITLIWAIVSGCIAIAYIWLYFFEGKKELANGFGVLAPIVLAFATLKIREQPSEFELRQQAVLNEIDMILRER